MLSETGLTTAQVLDVFRTEVQAQGGVVSDVVDDGRHLMIRSISARSDDVRPGDRVQAGVALRGTEGCIGIHPYIFREVCRNGAIMPATLAERRLDDIRYRDPDEVLEEVRAGVTVCSSPEHFEGAVGRMRSSARKPVDFQLSMLSMVARVPAAHRGHLMPMIFQNFVREADSTRFGLGNAITATARETRDSETRWNLEELGGGILVGVIPTTPVLDAAARAARDEPELAY